MESVHANQDVTILNIHQRITALTVGRLDPKSNRDTLLIGTPTNLLAYDVERNADVFHKDVPDGVNALVVGQLGKVHIMQLDHIRFAKSPFYF